MWSAFVQPPNREPEDMTRRGALTSKPIKPPHGEAKTVIDKARRIRREGARGRDVRRHLSEADHDRPQDGPDKDIRDQTPRRAGLDQRGAGAQEEARADGAADGDEVEVAARQLPLQLALLSRVGVAGAIVALLALDLIAAPEHAPRADGTDVLPGGRKVRRALLAGHHRPGSDALGRTRIWPGSVDGRRWGGGSRRIPSRPRWVVGNEEQPAKGGFTASQAGCDAMRSGLTNRAETYKRQTGEDGETVERQMEVPPRQESKVRGPWERGESELRKSSNRVLVETPFPRRVLGLGSRGARYCV